MKFGSSEDKILCTISIYSASNVTLYKCAEILFSAKSLWQHQLFLALKGAPGLDKIPGQ